MSLFRRRAPKPQAEPQARPQPDFAGEVPVVNGVQASLNWAVPYTNNDNNYHMPPGEYTEKTKENFFKVLKNEFNIDFEANWRDAVSRFVVTNPTTKDFLERYAANMEEYEIMPHCQEKYQLMEKDEYQKAPAGTMPAPSPKSASVEYAETLVFIHFSAYSIFRELPASSAKIRYCPAADSILKTILLL